MVITPLLAKNIPVEVPMKAEVDDQPEQIKEQVVVKLFADRHIEINTKPVRYEEIDQVIGDALSGRPADEKIVFFEGEDDAPYGLAVRVLDSVKGAGAVTLGMMTPNRDEDAGSGETAPAEAASAP